MDSKEKNVAVFTENERLQYEKAQQIYLETQRRKSELSEKDKKLFQKLESVEIGRYDVSCATIIMIADVYQGSVIDAFDTIFRLGFLKGEQKARNDMRKGKNR